MFHVLGSEIGRNEIFLGNTRTDNPSTNRDYLSHLKTLRLGKQALDLDGKPIDPSEYVPLFVHKSEIDEYNRVMEKQVSNIRNGIK